MKRTFLRLWMTGLLSAITLGSASQCLAAPGSWIANVPRLNVSSCQVDRQSAEMTAPSGQRGIIDSVSWQYRSPPGSRMTARLCLQDRCLRLDLARGTSRYFAGLPASGPFTFRFRLADGQQPVVVDSMSLIVNHR